MTDKLKIVEQIVKDAGEVLMKYYGNIKPMYKDNDRYDIGSVLTKADLESEELIVKKLKEHFPTHGIYAEEKNQFGLDKEFVWYVDPLDGTSNFVRNIPLFGISIGLVHKGKAVLGVLYFPAIDLMVCAEKGKGTYANGQKINVSSRELKESLYYAGGYWKGEKQEFEEISQNVGFTKIISASSYEFAQIAMGDAEIYYLVNAPHDVAAGIVIVNEAGGRVTDENGDGWSLDSKMILATNGVVHDEVLKLVNF